MPDFKPMIDKLSAMSALISGATEEELLAFIERCRQALGVTPPSEHIEFLGLCDGGAENGVFLYSTRPAQFADCAGLTNDFIEVNLNWRDLEWMSDYLVLGDSEMDVFVFEISSNKYQIRDRQVFDNIYEEYLSFDGMLRYALELMLQD
ncbi:MULTISPECIES: YrhA family protein [unclassified Pseudomonas]|uniref:YrhA family protein n=1 Tax=unclassified Pseudomonas TaxID=196821 RepID=UPI00117B8081|nr:MULTISPECIES: YrhA family protein [unclassified Pseudomonas]